jgi:hypothetical protein
MIDLCSLLDYATIISFLQPPEMKAGACYGRALEEARVSRMPMLQALAAKDLLKHVLYPLQERRRRRIRRIRRRRRNGEEEGTVSGNDDEEDEDDENDDEDCCYFFSEFLAAAGRGPGPGTAVGGTAGGGSGPPLHEPRRGAEAMAAVEGMGGMRSGRGSIEVNIAQAEHLIDAACAQLHKTRAQLGISASGGGGGAMEKVS